MAALGPNSVINDRYKVVSVLGKGGMATVYLALDQSNQSNVALKFLNPDQLRVSRRKARFAREFSILSNLNHPSVVKVFEQGQTPEGLPFFSMETVEGQTLATLIKKVFEDKSEISNTETFRLLNLLKQIAGALEYLHSANIVYCDLKPDNIIVSQASEDSASIRLVDFGIAENLNEPSPEEGPNMVGTSYYMSPEQIRSEKLSPRSDIYSFGVVAFETLTGSVPFASEALFTVTASHLIGKVPLAHVANKNIPSLIDRMIRICMEKNIADRYEGMSEVSERLESVLKSGLKRPSILQRLTLSSLFKGN